MQGFFVWAGLGCACYRAFTVAATFAYCYPDVVVTCSPKVTAPDAPKDNLTEPSLSAEVQSASTETTDRR